MEMFGKQLKDLTAKGIDEEILLRSKFMAKAALLGLVVFKKLLVD